MSGEQAWTPHPDPALTDPARPGLRPHRHEPDHLYGWVFLQHQVWVDYWGNEHEIELMPRDYVENVIAFCLQRGEQIQTLVLISTTLQIIGGADIRREWLLQVHQRAAELAPDELPAWLAELPLLRALNERLRVLDSRSD